MDLNDTRHKKPKLALKDSKSSPLTHITDNPLDDSPQLDNQTNQINNPTGIIHHHLIQKKTISHNKMTRLKLFPKRKQPLHCKTNNRTSSTLHSSPVQNPTLPHYSNVSTTPNDYIVDNTPVNIEFDGPVKVY